VVKRGRPSLAPAVRSSTTAAATPRPLSEVKRFSRREIGYRLRSRRGSAPETQRVPLMTPRTALGAPVALVPAAVTIAGVPRL
jgi:hypothetical protein